MEWSDEKSDDDIRLYVYAGADASFTLYEDDGLTYAYEDGRFSRIKIFWDDSSRTLTVGQREGSFPGMLEKRRFTAVVVDGSHPRPFDPDCSGKTIDYEWNSVSVEL